MQSSPLPSYLSTLHNNACSAEHESPHHAGSALHCQLLSSHHNTWSANHEAPHPLHSPVNSLPYNKIPVGQIMQFLIMQSSPFPIYLPPLTPK